MQDFLSDMPLLVEVARWKSFSKAAEVLNIGASTLSRRIRLLEESMGVLLFYRDTRNVELTPNGAFLLDRCDFILAETRKTYDAVVKNMLAPSGLVRVCMYVDAYTSHLRKTFSAFAAKWPDIRLHLTFTDHPVDMRIDPYDVAFLISPVIAAPLVARKLFTIEPFLYAAPALLERYPKPATPQDLYSLPIIALRRMGKRWTLTREERQVTLEIEANYLFDSGELCREFAVAGHGVALLRKELAAPDVKTGRLIGVLPEWRGPVHNLNLVTAPGELSQRVRLFTDHIYEWYAALARTV